MIFKIKNYRDIKSICGYVKEKTIIVDVEECSICQRKRIVDFLGGLSYFNFKLKKINKYQYVIEGV